MLPHSPNAAVSPEIVGALTRQVLAKAVGMGSKNPRKREKGGKSEGSYRNVYTNLWLFYL